VVAVFGDSARSGAWLPPDELRAVAGFGNVRLDFREADLPPGPTEIRAFAVFGNVELLVPRGLDVELSGVSLFGSVHHRSDRKAGRQILDRVLGRRRPIRRPTTAKTAGSWSTAGPSSATSR
jgi:predicted membrane protein